MKVLAIMIMLASLFFLYRIAYPKQAATKKDGDIPKKDTKPVRSVMGKSRFVLPDRSKPLQTPATSPDIDNSEKKSNIFAPENEARNPVIPKEQLDEVFDDTNPEDLDIELDEDEKEDETEEVYDEGAELEQGAELASGLSIEEMTDAAKAIDNPTDEKADILFKVEKTDMFEQMVSSDEGKAERIKAIITRYIQNLPSENAYEDSNNSNIENVDVMGFLRITKK